MVPSRSASALARTAQGQQEQKDREGGDASPLSGKLSLALALKVYSEVGGAGWRFGLLSGTEGGGSGKVARKMARRRDRGANSARCKAGPESCTSPPPEHLSRAAPHLAGGLRAGERLEACGEGKQEADQRAGAGTALLYRFTEI